MSARKKERNNFFVQMHPLTRLGISVGLALFAFFVLKKLRDKHFDSCNGILDCILAHIPNL